MELIKLIKLTDRIIIDMRNATRTPMDGYEIQQTLCKIGEDIYNGYSGGVKTTDIHEVQWRHETKQYGGFRYGVISEETMNDIRELVSVVEKNQNEKYDYLDALDCAAGNLRTAIELLTQIIEENER